MITARVVADSLSPVGKRITTFVLTYPRFIHSEFMTHRIFSKNSSSSRAIPVGKMIEAINCSPAMPEYYGAAQKGMQAAVEMLPEQIVEYKRDIDTLRGNALGFADKWKLVAHKQTLNRYLEPWAHITVLCTSTEWGNFFNLRAHREAQPEIRMLAVAMLRAGRDSKAMLLGKDEWHMPFGDQMPEDAPLADKLKIATARAARVSYLNFEGSHDPLKDIALHDQLAASGHWSPFEHCAQALHSAQIMSGNFRGWGQYRKLFANEHQREFNAEKLLAEWEGA